MIYADSIVEAVIRQSFERPTSLALSDGTKQLTYAKLAQRVVAKQRQLSSRYSDGAALLLCSKRNVETVENYLAAHLAGLVVVPIDPDAPASRLLALADVVRAGGYAPVCDASFDGIHPTLQSVDFSDLPEEMEPTVDVVTYPEKGQIADIVFTSGTTGKPKAIALRHENLVSSVENIFRFQPVEPEDQELCALPLSHSFAMTRVRLGLSCGAHMIIYDGFSRLKQFNKYLTSGQISGFSMVPAVFQILKSKYGDRFGEYFGGLKYIEMGSAWLSADDKRWLQQQLPNTRIFMHYGSTEASRSTFLCFRDTENLDTVGRSGPLVSVKVFDDQGLELGAEEQGEICVKGPMVISEYWNDENSTSTSFFGQYFRTGDLGSLTADGYLRYAGRQKETLNVNGRNVMPMEIELACEQIVGSVEVGVCELANADAPLSECIALFVAPVANDKPLELDKKQLLAELGSQLEAYKIPQRVFLVSELPKTHNGKIKRLSLPTLVGRPDCLEI